MLVGGWWKGFIEDCLDIGEVQLDRIPLGRLGYEVICERQVLRTLHKQVFYRFHFNRRKGRRWAESCRPGWGWPVFSHWISNERCSAWSSRSLGTLGEPVGGIVRTKEKQDWGWVPRAQDNSVSIVNSDGLQPYRPAREILKIQAGKLRIPDIKVKSLPHLFRR